MDCKMFNVMTTEERFFDSQGFSYTVYRNGINKVVVEVDTHKEEFIVQAHLKALEWFRKKLIFTNMFEIFDHYLICELEKIQKIPAKFNKQISRNQGLNKEIIPCF